MADKDDVNDYEDEGLPLQLAVWETCRMVADEYNVAYSYDFINGLSSLMYKTTGNISRKLELFAKHGKRSEINVDDIKLYFRSFRDLIKVIDDSGGTKIKAECHEDGESLFRSYIKVDDSGDLKTEDACPENGGNSFRSYIHYKKLSEKSIPTENIIPDNKMLTQEHLLKKNISQKNKKSNDAKKFEEKLLVPKSSQKTSHATQKPKRKTRRL